MSLTPTCAEAARLVSAGLDRPLPFWHRIRLRMHFRACLWCGRYERQVTGIRNALRQAAHTGDVTAGAPGLSPEARSRIEATLRSRPSTDGSTNPVPPG